MKKRFDKAAVEFWQMLEKQSTGVEERRAKRPWALAFPKSDQGKKVFSSVMEAERPAPRNGQDKACVL